MISETNLDHTDMLMDAGAFDDDFDPPEPLGPDYAEWLDSIYWAQRAERMEVEGEEF